MKRSMHPLIEIFGRPFEPEMLSFVMPQLQDDILAVLLGNAPANRARRTPSAPMRAHHARQAAAGDHIGAALPLALAEDALLCGELDDGRALPGGPAAAGAVYRQQHRPCAANMRTPWRASRRP
jgi:hypothetical protein